MARIEYMNLNFLNASRIMSNNEMQELSDKLRRGLQLAEKRLLEKNAVSYTHLTLPTT